MAPWLHATNDRYIISDIVTMSKSSIKMYVNVDKNELTWPYLYIYQWDYNSKLPKRQEIVANTPALISCVA